MPDTIAFLSYVLITTFTPGPNNILSMLNAGRAGLRQGLRFNIGIFIGFAIVMTLCGMFGSVLIASMPAIKPSLKYIGAVYILMLAYKTLKSDYKSVTGDGTGLYSMKEGLTLQFVNPKVILYGITTLSTFVVPYYDRSITLFFAAGLAAVAFMSNLCWAFFGSAFHRILKKYSIQVNIVMSLMLVYSAISLVI